jgi:long-chain fatty acid transport protein
MNTRLILTWSLAVLSPLALQGSGTRIYCQDAAALAQGNAFAATADNASAIYYNPAGITQLEGQNFRGGLMLTLYDFDYHSDAGRHLDTIEHLRGAPQLFYTYSPEKLPLSFGLGVYSPYGLGHDWPDDSPFRTLVTRIDLLYATINPVVAWKVCDRLSLAVGPTLNYAQLDSRRGLVVPGDEFRFRGDGFAPGFNAGLLWAVHEKHHFGVSYRSATTVVFRGHTSVENLTPDIPGLPPSGRQEASLELPFPQNATVAWSYRPTPAWNLEFDVQWTDWDHLNTATLKQPYGDLPQVFNWHSTFEFNWGVTHHFKNGYSVSAGYTLADTVPYRTPHSTLPCPICAPTVSRRGWGATGRNGPGTSPTPSSTRHRARSGAVRPHPSARPRTGGTRRWGTSWCSL